MGVLIVIHNDMVKKSKISLVIWILFCLIPINLFAKQETIRFKSIARDKGLSQVSAECMVRDNKGFIWVGTQDGLNRYDGYGFKIYKNDPSNPHSISDNYIVSMIKDHKGDIWIATENGLNELILEKELFIKYFHREDSQNSLNNNHVRVVYEAPSIPGTLWIGTEGGLDKLNIKTEKFSHYQNNPDDINSLCNNLIQTLYEAPSLPGVLWIGTIKGLDRFDIKKGEFTHFSYDPRSSNSICHDNIRVLYETSSLPGILWIGTEDGLDCFDIKKKQFTHYEGHSKIINTISHNHIRALYEPPSRPGILWIGTFGNGLYKLDINKKKFSHYTHETNNLDSLNDNFIRCLFEDESQILWIGTQIGGINQCHQSTKDFMLYQHNPNNKNSLSNRVVHSIYESSVNPPVLWIGTYSGLDRLDLETGTFTYYTHDINNPKSLSSKLVRAILEDDKQRIWVGTYNGGLNLFNSKTGEFTRYLHDPNDPFTLSHNYVRTLYQDRSGILWIGTVGGGLNRFDEKNNRFFHYVHDPKNSSSISHDRIYDINQDQTGTLWIGTSEGLNRFDKSSETFRVYTHDPKDPNSLGNNMVMCVFEDRSGQLWVGTWGGGINRFDGKSETFVRYTKKDGLANNVVYGILEDDSGNLWCSTNNGLSRFNPQKKTFKNYDVTDGLQGNEFNSDAYLLGKNGKMYFGGVNGLTAFYPQKIIDNPYKPPIVITNFQIFNNEVPHIHKDGEKGILSKSITYTDAITLFYKNDIISFEYSGLSYISPEKNRYAYIMQGLEEQWNYVGNRRFVTYTKIPPGIYTFKVKGSNNDGVWNETGRSLKITILPPFWKTWWFRGLLIFMFIIFIYSIYYFRTRNLTKRKRVLEQLIKNRTAKLITQNKELESLSIVAQKTDNAVLIMDSNGNIEWINEGFTRMYEYTYDQLLNERGKNLRDISKKNDILKIFNSIINNKMPVTYESYNNTRSGKKVFVQTVLTPILDKSRKLAKLVAIDSNITPLKKANEIAEKERLIAQKANMAKSDFLARMSHEIRTPMNGVIGFTEMLLETKLNDEQRDYVKTISSSGEALLSLINDILDFSKIEAGKMTFEMIDFDPELMAYDVCDIIAPRAKFKSIEIICNIGDDVPDFIKSDPGRFRQVLINVMGNAVKFTEEGEVELSMEVTEEQEKELKLHVKVRDTGKGIAADKLDDIFDTFTQGDESIKREYGGTGLGLSICKQIAKRMKGDIWAESNINNGSTLHFIATVEKSIKKVKPLLGKEDLSQKSVLIVDDNKKNLKNLSNILKSAGMIVNEVSDSRKVIGELTKMVKDKGCDICIIDILMPYMDGYKIAQKIKKMPKPFSKMPLLAFSSSVGRQLSTYKDAGFDGFLPKPIHGRKLLKMIQRLLTGDAKKKEQKIQTQYSIEEDKKHSIHILLAEDNPINQKFAQYLLTKAGYGLTIVANGKEAVDKIKSDPKKYNLVLMDIQMPVMDGLKATKKIRGYGFKDIPIIAITAESMKGDRERCLKAGMNDYIAKPIKREKIFKLIKKWYLK